MVRTRTPRVLPRGENVAETIAEYGETTRFNLVVPRALKAQIDRYAAARGVTGPELARRLLEQGLSRIEAEGVWIECARVAKKVAARDRALLARLDRWEFAWERARR